MESGSCRCPLGAVRHCIEEAKNRAASHDYDDARESLAEAERLLQEVQAYAAGNLQKEIEKIRLLIADTGEWDFSGLRRQ